MGNVKKSKIKGGVINEKPKIGNELKQLVTMNPWEPPDTTIVGNFQVEGPLFLTRFSERFFLFEKWCQMDPRMASQMSQNLMKSNT